MTDDAANNLFERRRYSGVLLSHPRMRRFSDLKSQLGTDLGSSTPISGVAGWAVRRVEILDDRIRYPATQVEAESVERAGGFAHDCYVAIRAESGTELPGPAILLAAPYKGLLRKVVRRLLTDMHAPKPIFVVPDMTLLFESLELALAGVEVTRITMKLSGEPGVDFISLAGRSPLISKLRRTLDSEKATQELGVKYKSLPYASRLELAYSHELDGADATLRLHLDLHGNYWWHQAREQALSVACGGIDYLLDHELMLARSKSPLDRRDRDD